MTKITVCRYHDFSAGHRVYGHEGKCKYLHGHNYRVHFTCIADHLDEVGRVIDFSVIKDILCNWLEENWDHRFLVWKNDPICSYLKDIDKSVVEVSFNPTAENMGKYLIHEMNLKLSQLEAEFRLKEIVIEETRKCKATIKI